MLREDRRKDKGKELKEREKECKDRDRDRDKDKDFYKEKDRKYKKWYKSVSSDEVFFGFDERDDSRKW